MERKYTKLSILDDDIYKECEKIIDDILNEFDFNKIHKVMVLLNWSWYSSKSVSGIPSIQEMIKTATHLLESVIVRRFQMENEEEYIYIGSGGFYVYSIYNTIKLEFRITEWECFFNERKLKIRKILNHTLDV
jgi:hypothetical protein